MRILPLLRTQLSLKYLQSHLVKNAFYMFLYGIVNALFGLIFWLVAARLYPVEDIGIATALISSILLVTGFTRFADPYMIRFMPEGNKNAILGTTMLVSISLSTILGGIFIAGIDIFSPDLSTIIQSNSLLFIVFLIAYAAALTIGTAFIALRRPEYSFFMSLTSFVKIPALFLLISIGAVGIFCAVGISFTVMFLVVLVMMIWFGIKPWGIDRGFFRQGFKYSTNNYLSDLLLLAPNQILPILVLNILGAEPAAFYYMAYTIISLLFMVSNTLGVSLVVEGSHGESLRGNALKSLFLIFLAFTPISIALYLGGEWLLSLIGVKYIAALPLIRVMIIGCFFVAIRQIYFSIKKVDRDTKPMVYFSILVFILLIGLSYLMGIEFGIIGVAYAWTISQGIVSIAILGPLRRDLQKYR
jgi:O-antigen/teichoic acid export membrane protein